MGAFRYAHTDTAMNTMMDEIEKLTKPEVIAFIQEHWKDDPAELALKAHQYPDLPMKEIAGQIASRQKAERKLPEWFNDTEIIFSPKQNLEQASSEQTARFKARFLKGERLADLTGGSGVDVSYLSVNFRKSVYVEPNPELCELAKHNFKVLGKNIQVKESTAERFLEENTIHFDWIFIDPSRRDDQKNRVYALEDCVPNVFELKDRLPEASDQVLIKASPMLDIKKALKQFPECYKVQVVAIENEAKELLLYLKAGFEGDAEIEAWNLSETKDEKYFGFTYREEKETIATIDSPHTYLYEPNSAIIKSGGYNLISSRFGIHKLHSNTHLYSSGTLIDDFPGRVLCIKEIFKPSKKEIRKRIPGGKVNVVVRNYPSGANEVKKKFSLVDGGDDFLVFCEIEGKGFKTIWCNRIL